jgi:DNA-binding CsgD family transcriptional regulator
LVRAAVYRAATLQERQRVHRALAEATDPELDPDRRAWHRAQAAPGPDEDVAAELERSADRAQARGGLAAAAAFLEQATALTLEPGRRATRALAAAQAKLEAGAPDMALDLLVTAETGPLDELQQARVDLLRAKIACVVDGGNDAVPLLLDAARQLEPLDVRLARETYLDALSAALYAGHPASGDRVLEVAHAALAAPPAAQPGLASDLLLDGLALRFTDGYAAAMPILKRALTAFRSEDISTEEGIRWLWLACTTAVDLWDDESWEILSTRHVDLARDAGAVTVLPLALGQRISVHVHAGELATAASLIQELTAVNEAIGSERPTVAALWLAACRGREAEASELVDAAMKELTRQGPGVRASIIRGASATLYNGLGHYERALAAAEHGSECPEQLGTSTRALIELVEAAARCGLPDRAADALERLSATTCISATDWALGIEARSRALLTDDETAEELYREAIDRLGRTRVRVELARTHLLYGEWLRRERRRIDAREQLRTAHQLFASMGIGGFAQRAARELRATGETARKRTIEASGRLTAQEAQISRLARDGLSNPEIGSQLFISPRTVEYHLHKVFAKLNIRSRKELDRVLPSEQVAASAV